MRAVFLDRDGVLNAAVTRQGRPHPPDGVATLEILPGVEDACRRLRNAGFLLVCVTNQPDIARGTTTRSAVDAINAALGASLGIRHFVVCPHDDADRCECRKPRPGMLLAAAAKYGIDLPRSVMVGDRWRDIAAGRAAGCRAVFVDHGYAEEGPSRPDFVCHGLAQAAEWIIARMTCPEGEQPMSVAERVKIFADGADIEGIAALSRNPVIKGFTTNPTLMRVAGVTDYLQFARAVLSIVRSHPISLEVFADEPDEMHRQALLLSGLSGNVYVKIPVTNTRGESCAALIRSLVAEGVKLNVTALLTLPQVAIVAEALRGSAHAFISVFAGRIADTGRDPLPIMQAALDIMREQPALELIWASPREVYNIYQAAAIGCHAITVSADLLRKLNLGGKDLDEYSLETVRMFYTDAAAAGFKLIDAKG
jgi:transaldolase